MAGHRTTVGPGQANIQSGGGTARVQMKTGSVKLQETVTYGTI